MAYDAGLAERVSDALARAGRRSIRQKNVFGGRGFLSGKSTFVIVSSDKLIVKVPRHEYDAALGEYGVTPFTPGGERAMSTWVVVSGEAVADDPELLAWVERGLRSLGA